jgi:uncharacterized protein (TIGR03084 family)
VTSMDAICDDLTAEHESLDVVLADIDLTAWDAPTHAEGWMVRDQLSHLAYFDAHARDTVTDPDGARVRIAEDIADLPGLVARPVSIGRAMEGAELLEWWRDARRSMVASFRALEPSTRVPWYGPDMSAASFATARLMETWAHGQDVVDALGARREPSARLRHIAHLGVRALPNSFRARHLEVPSEPVRVELVAPDGSTWEWGQPGVDDVVTGSALDFCLVVTRRRHRADTWLKATGPVANRWMDVAQVFAGPPGADRVAGQFRPTPPPLSTH